MGFLIGKALPHQYKYIYTKTKFTALVSGLGAGKTRALLYRLLHFITNVPGATIAVYEPTIELLKRVIYPELTELLEGSGIPFKLNRTDGLMEVWLPHGKCSIIFRSMENPNRIIGYNCMLSLIDEIDTMPQEKATAVYIRIMARNRKKFKYLDGTIGVNQIGITTTPEGFSFVYKTWVKDHSKDPDYELIRGRTTDNYHLPTDYVDNLRRNFPPQLVDAYINGMFVNLKGNTVYDGFNRVKSNTNLTINDFPESQMVLIGEDFNINRSCAVVGMKSTDGDGRIYIVDEFFNLMDTPAMIRAIRARYPDRMITIYPDASGSSRKSVDSSKSDHKLLRDAGFRINAPRKNPPVRESVISTNVMFLNSEGDRNLFVNIDKCPNLTEALEKQIYDDNSAPLKDGVSDDVNDALRYLINRAYGLAKPTASIARMRFGV